MIRPATIDDIPRLVELGHLLHQTSRYSSHAYDGDVVGSFMAQLIAGTGVVFVAERDGKVIGALLGGITEQWFSTELLAFEYAFFVEPGARHGIISARLVQALTTWAELRGAKHVQIGVTTGINVEGTAQFYRAHGFQDAGLFFEKAI
ncbi:GNAT family N-acetyltransferase [Ectopseudomonas alcaliphila]|uniref:GNAT family N-acetyltransferase n=1 Tax=Ectopseudomonas alcaliphila TaxID=101564 RepID=A0A1G7JG35_9GAMM|nr:GNAT family N-acetyltransferase [Pseudomonas alcaliphila]MDX5990470.1 GNAT family N-acetyltransferase [Pseudomonas alcaliphila]MDX5995440.1 GNAT family N-acetyltransferase [Pseudomonas alcaliphila]MDX5995485.1 GNAT family N-acetyltransferase [Pseudomonas alcaliphila]SDF23886.1 L-amino acid N-acyltransferase YncA [Pseudomonas alcaliphila]